MKLLANENFPGLAVDALQEEGHDVVWVRTEAPGSTDEEVLSHARAEDRILLTFDKDFGELAFRSGLPGSTGIVLFRTSLRSPSAVAQIAVRALASRKDWAGHFSVVEENRIRMTPLPGVSPPTE
jgi:predicted nuclease of predicted toxin-antitoxin system